MLFYGALLLLQDDVCTRSTAEWVYREIFSKQRVAEHILVRDYACKMVELGQSRGLNIVVEQSLIAVPSQMELCLPYLQAMRSLQSIIGIGQMCRSMSKKKYWGSTHYFVVYGDRIQWHGLWRFSEDMYFNIISRVSRKM